MTYLLERKFEKIAINLRLYYAPSSESRNISL